MSEPTKTREGHLSSRYGERWPLTVLQSPDGAYFAEVSFEDALCMRYGDHKEGEGVRFVDPDGGPFIGIGFPIVVTIEPPLVAEVTSIEPPTEDNGVYTLRLSKPKPPTKNKHE